MFFKGHVGRTAHCGTGFGVVREFHGNKTTGIEDEVGLFEEVFAFNGDQFRVSGTGPDDLDESPAFDSTIHGNGKSKVIALAEFTFLFFKEQTGIPGRSQGGGLGDAGGRSYFTYFLRGVGNGDVPEFVGRVRVH